MLNSKLFFGKIGFTVLALGVLLQNGYSQNELSKSEIAFSKIKIKEGTRDVTLQNDYGNKFKMRVNFPKQTGKKNKLIIAMHWLATGDTSYKEFNDCLALPGLGFLNTIIVSPESERHLWWTENNVDKVLSIVKNAKKYWNVDAEKIAIVGYSDGGSGCWYFADKYPEFFSAAIPIASSYPIIKKVDIPLYVIHSEKDDLFPVSDTRKWVEKTKKAGSNVALVINTEYGHKQACSYIEDLKDAGKWLEKIWN